MFSKLCKNDKNAAAITGQTDHQRNQLFLLDKSCKKTKNKSRIAGGNTAKN